MTNLFNKLNTVKFIPTVNVTFNSNVVAFPYFAQSFCFSTSWGLGFSHSRLSLSIFDETNFSFDKLKIHEKKEFIFLKDVYQEYKIKFEGREHVKTVNLGSYNDPLFASNLQDLFNSFLEFQFYAMFFSSYL